MTDVSIRPAAADDARAIQRVARDSWQAAYDTVLEANRIDETIDEWCDPERLVVDDIEQPERPVSVATIDNEVVGFVEAVPDENGDELAHLYRIYVAPGQWGRGIGGSLLDHVEAVLDERRFHDCACRCWLRTMSAWCSTNRTGSAELRRLTTTTSVSSSTSTRSGCNTATARNLP